MTKTRMMVFITLTPETLAASSLEPTAYMFLPKAVLFQMTQTMKVMIAEYSTYRGTDTPWMENRGLMMKSR